MDTATRIRTARLAAGLTQQQLAERAGITQGAISRIEAGSRAPSLSRLVAIAHALNVPVADLIEEDQ